jgi:hypothetical protein
MQEVLKRQTTTVLKQMKSAVQVSKHHFNYRHATLTTPAINKNKNTAYIHTLFK